MQAGSVWIRGITNRDFSMLKTGISLFSDAKQSLNKNTGI